MNKSLFNIFNIIFIFIIIYILFFYQSIKSNFNIIDNFNLTLNPDSLDGKLNAYSDNTPNLQSIKNFIQKNPGAKLFYVRDSASFMLTTNTWIFIYDPYQPSNPNGTYLANINGSPIFGNQMIYQIKPINLVVDNSQIYNNSFYMLNVKTQNSQNMYINFIVNLIQVQSSNPYITIDGTHIESIKLKPGQPRLTNVEIQLNEGFGTFSSLDGSSMATGSTGLNNPSTSSGIPDLSNFLKTFPGAQAYYIYQSTSESILPSNSIVYMYNPYDPNNTNGRRLATSIGTSFFNGEYPLELHESKTGHVYGIDPLDTTVQTYLKDGYTLFDAIPFYETSPLKIFRFSVFARKVPNGTWIN